MRSQNKTLPGAVLALLAALLSLLPADAQRMPQDSWYLAKEFRGDIEGGKFYHPRDASVGPDGNVYVADQANHQVQVFDTEGNSLRKWGNYGSESGQFRSPIGIQVTPDGKVYVAEWENHRVQVFDSQGKFLRSMGQYGNGEGQLNGPHGLAVDNDGNVYVVEHNNSRVTAFRPDGTYLRQWGSAGTADGQFQAAIAMCRTPDNKIAVLERDGNRRIQVFNTDGTFAFKFGSSGSGNGQLDSPHGVETDSSGNFYVSQFNSGDRVTVFSPTGSYIRRFGSDGTGNGQFRDPTGMGIGNGRVFVTDHSGHRMTVFDTSGNWIKNFGGFGNRNFDDTHGIAVDAQGNIYISDHQKNEIRKFDANYNFIKRFGSAGSGDGQFNGVLEMAIGPNNRLYVVDHSGHRVQYFDLDGNFLGKFGSNGSGNGNFKYPWGIAVGKDNKVYVADRDNHRIQIFDANGNYLNKFGTQGSFDGQFQSPNGVAVLSDGRIMVNDRGNSRLQTFDAQGNVLKVSTRGWSPDRICASSDGQMYGAWPNGLALYDTFAMGPLKDWVTRGNGPIAETKSGDLICAHLDRVVRVWKRTFRTVHPEPANALPLPTIVAQKRRPGTALVDVDYTVKDADNATVQTAALAFKNGGNSLADVIPMTSFADGTGNKLGANIPTGQTHRFTWDVASDWSTDFGEVQLEILAKDGRGLLNLDFIQIPATGDQPALKISRSPLNNNDFLSVWYWLIATGDSGVRLENGAVVQAVDNLKAPGLWGDYHTITYYSNSRWSRADQIFSFDSWNDDNFYNETELGLWLRWIGEFLPKKTGRYTFKCGAGGLANIWIGGQKVVTDNSPATFTVSATASTPIPIRIDYDGWGAGRKIFWLNIVPPGESERAAVGSDFQHAPPLASGTGTTATGRAYLFQKMGLREATAAEVTRAKEAGMPGVINQWDPKLRVGPDERPAKINAYGFDTGADGYWVVPVTNTNSSN